MLYLLQLNFTILECRNFAAFWFCIFAFSQCSTFWSVQAFDGENIFEGIFNFAILSYSWNSRNMVYSIVLTNCSGTLSKGTSCMNFVEAQDFSKIAFGISEKMYNVICLEFIRMLGMTFMLQWVMVLCLAFILSAVDQLSPLVRQGFRFPKVFLKNV